MVRMPAAVTLTLAEAAAMLDPPVSERQLRAIVSALRWQPSGQRRTGRQGFPALTYDSAEILKLHGALTPWLRTG